MAETVSGNHARGHKGPTRSVVRWRVYGPGAHKLQAKIASERIGRNLGYRSWPRPGDGRDEARGAIRDVADILDDVIGREFRWRRRPAAEALREVAVARAPAGGETAGQYVR